MSEFVTAAGLVQVSALEASAAGAEGEPSSPAKATPAAAIPLALRKHGSQDVIHLSAPAPKAATLLSALLNLLIRPACKPALVFVSVGHSRMTGPHICIVGMQS